jgi:ELWxxDGT repeat protein
MRRLLILVGVVPVIAALTIVATGGTARASSEVVAVVTTAPELPISIADPPGASGSGVDVRANFLTTFAMVTEVCVDVEFQDDLLDNAEIITFNWADGQIWRDNNTSDSFPTATACTTSTHEAMNRDAIDGIIDLRVEIMEGAGFASVKIRSIEVTAVGTVTTGPVVPTSPTAPEALEEWLYFAGFTPAEGHELWRTDGAVFELVADLDPGPGDSSPRALEVLNGWVYFGATTPGIGDAVWRTDGTTTAIVPGSEGLDPHELEAMDDWAYFPVSSPETGYVLLRTDGMGVEALNHDVPGLGNICCPHYLEAMDGWLYFTGDSALDFKLFRTDGASMELVADISEDPDNGEWPYEKEAMDGWVYFSADDWGNYRIGRELWRSDGATTELVADILAGPGAGSDPGGFEAMGGWLYFNAYSIDTGRELWRSNGTDVTELVADIHPGESSSSPTSLQGLDGWVYFSADAPGTGAELWRSNGTDVTELVADINPGAAGSSPYDLEAMRGWVYFGADPAGSGKPVLWRTDGTVTEAVGAPSGEVVFSGMVDDDKLAGPKWVSTVFAPVAGGAHVFTLDWAGGADLGLSVKDPVSGVTLGSDTSGDHPKHVTVDLVAGKDYRVNVWARSGSADFTVTVEASAPPSGEVVFSGMVDDDKLAGPRWSRAFYTPKVTGDHELVLDWIGDGWLQINVRDAATNEWVGSNLTTDHPKSLTVPLEAGTEYRVAVWSVSGVGDFTVTVYPPGG